MMQSLLIKSIINYWFLSSIQKQFAYCSCIQLYCIYIQLLILLLYHIFILIFNIDTYFYILIVGWVGRFYNFLNYSIIISLLHFFFLPLIF